MKTQLPPKTIKQWQRRQQKWLSTDRSEPFTDGHLMPIVGTVEHLCPKGKAYLFSALARRWSGVLDQNHESFYKRGKWRTATSAKHIIYVVSVAVFDGRNLQWLRGPSDIVKDFILPEGWKWIKDELGIAAIDTDGIDYHPHWTAELETEHILQGHAANKERRRQQLEQKHHKVAFDIAFKANVHNTWVLLEDSRRAGNCVEGSLAWAEQRLGIPRDDILAAPFIVMVPARRLMGDERAEAAARCAFERETTVSI